MTSTYSHLGDELKQIRENLRQLESSYQTECLELRRRLNQWEHQWREAKPATEPVKEAPPQEEVPKMVLKPAKIQATTASIAKAVVPPAQPKPKAQKTSLPPPPKEPKPLPPALQMLLHPFNQGIEYLKGIYQHYREEGKLPVFFMTLGGILALLFGFGYLMQMGISIMLDHLSERTFLILKLSVSFLASTGIILWGKRLIAKAEHYRDFGAAMLGLGIAINYLLLYFIGDNVLFPTLQRPIIGWTLALANSAVGVWLGLKQEARIVAVISLLGGAFVPFYLHSTSFSIFYLGYLWVLSFTAIWLSQKIKWQPLQIGAFLVFAFLVEWIWFQHPERFNLLALSIGLHAFVYLFVSAAIREGKQWREQFDIHHLFLLAASISLGILNLFLLYQANDALELLGWVFIGNAAVISLGLALRYHKLSPHLRWIAFLLIGGLVGIAIPSIFDQSWMGLAWAFEGMLLVLMGHRFAHERLRVEGLLVLTIALLKMLYFLPPLFNYWGVQLWNVGFIQWLCLGISILGLWGIYRRYTAKSEWEQWLSKHLTDGLSLWLALTLMLLSTWFLGIWGWLFAGIATIGLLQIGNRLQLPFSEAAGFAFMLFLLIPYGISASLTDSLAFHNQLLPAKLSIALLALIAFSLQSIYEKSLKENRFWPLVRGLREVVWLILPAVWLKPIIRLYPEHLAPALLISMIGALALQTYLKSKERLFVDMLLYASSFVYLAGIVIAVLAPFEEIIYAEQLSTLPAYYYSYIPILAFIAQGLYRRIFQRKAAKEWWEVAFLWSGLLIFHGIVHTFEFRGLAFALVLVGLYYKLVVPFALQKFGEPDPQTFLRVPAILLIVLGFFSFAVVVVLGGQRIGLGMLVLVIFMAWVTYRSAKQEKKLAFPNVAFSPWLFHLLLPMFYLPFQASLIGTTENIGGPAATALIVIHAVVLLFSSRRFEKTAFVRFSMVLFVIGFGKLVFYDFSHFSILNKVLVSMGIGAIMLLGSRLFLRLRSTE
ncbi:MAG: DUF2339 domain-containing protein [Bacteroidota bacterium]